MKQYLEIKEQYKDCLLFFRLGDFYELFLDDAKTGAAVLDITLTSRDRGRDGRIPMAGVPYHAIDSYLAKLVKAGYKVAICEQVSEPGKELVEREVVRVVTPGTILDEKALDRKENNYLVALEKKGNLLGIAFADISTGSFSTKQIEIPGPELLEQTLVNELSQIRPSECILSDHLYNEPQLLKALRKYKNLNIFRFDDWGTYSDNADKHLKAHFKVRALDGLGLGNKPYAVKAASVLLGYLKHTQKDRVGHIREVGLSKTEKDMELDRSTIVNLELFQTLRDGERRGSLLEILDQTSTAMGGRLLRQWVLKPLSDQRQIEQRLNAVGELLAKRTLRVKLKEILSGITDFERLLSKLAVGVGNARDLINLKEGIKHVLTVKETSKETETELIKNMLENISIELRNLVEIVEKNITEEPPIELKNGNLIKTGVSKDLDALKQEISGSTEFIADLESKERERTGISSLKVKYNLVFGYYIEITKANLHMVPKDYFRKQTLVNAERFYTNELKHHEEIILTAREKINELEYSLFLETVEKILEQTREIQKAAKSTAVLDCLLNFAELAEKENYCKPAFLQTGDIFIKDGRHPVVEKLLESSQFVPNDVTLNPKNQQLLVLTGPNMAGKSVYLRQTALIVLMAQMGSYVPAGEANISLVDKIFVRSGAADVITSGLSTFMVEMIETAYILNNATNSSLIVMDEIGRGTSTFDGISIAWSVAEYLVTNPRVRPKTLFATHYHELQKLEEKFPDKIKNYQMSVDGTGENPVFLHKVMRGGADHSYGIAVAKLSGVPEEITDKAYKILEKLENGKRDKAAPVKNTVEEKNELVEMLENIDTNLLTPLEALNKLAELKRLAIKAGKEQEAQV